MTYRYQVINEFRSGVPQTPTGNVGPFRMLALHDTEGGVGLAGARGTLQFLIDRQDRNASYHEIWAWDVATKTFTALRIVPPTSAAHSVSPHSPANGGTYEPDAWVLKSLGSLWRDPNRYIYAVSVAGKVGDVNTWSGDPDFVAACKRRTAEIISHYNVLPNLAEHFRFNPSNRTDWGTLLTPKMGGLVFNKETIAVELKPVEQEWMVEVGATFYTAGPGLGERKVFTERIRVRTIAESADGVWRLLQYGPELLWIKRTSLNAIAPLSETRNPPEGYGAPVRPQGGTTTVEVPTGITQEEVTAAHAEGVNDGVTQEKSRLRTLLGL